MRLSINAWMRLPPNAWMRLSINAWMRLPTNAWMRLSINAWMRLPTNSWMRLPTNAWMRLSINAWMKLPTNAWMRLSTYAWMRLSTNAWMRLLTNAWMRLPINAGMNLPCILWHIITCLRGATIIQRLRSIDCELRTCYTYQIKWSSVSAASFALSGTCCNCSIMSFSIVWFFARRSTTKHVVTIWYHVLTRPLNRIGPSRRLVPLSGMAYLSNCALFHVIFRARFIVSLRPSFSPGLGSERFWVVTLMGRYINSIDR